MRSELLPIPGLVLGEYPERDTNAMSGGVRDQSIRDLLFFNADPARRYLRIAKQALAQYEQLKTFPRQQVETRLSALRARMSRDGLNDEVVIEAFSIISCLCAQTLGFCPFHTQLIAAQIMLDNRLAEMATGEGKTLAAGICAATAALAGIPVHVMTSNDYLVTRDAETLGGLYKALGLQVRCVTQAMNTDERKQAYSANITYCTAKELVFDYMRDRTTKDRGQTDLHKRAARFSARTDASRETLLRGLCMAVVDEADSILIDEARVPLILSEQHVNSDRRNYYGHALRIAGALVERTDFRMDRRNLAVMLTDTGRSRLDQLATDLHAVWRNRLHREEIICQALAALHLYHSDRHYIVEEREVLIIDEMTGRASPGRKWSRGLHQLIECKEGCEFSGEQVTSAQITFQRFFQRYLRLGGMSGTIREARSELRSVYGLDVVSVPLRQPSRRKLLPTIVFPDRQAQWKAVVSLVQGLQESGQPVLIGTDTVAESEILSTLLDASRITHTVLNARQDKTEAQTVANAGAVGRVTVATNMAGRGTDIPLGAGAAELGGLHVISCQHNTSRRIDRQLIGRCARQGDPGSAQIVVCLEQPLIQRTLPNWLRKLVSRKAGLSRPAWLVSLVTRFPQLLEERRQRAQRRNMLTQDLKSDRDLAYAGGFE